MHIKQNELFAREWEWEFERPIFVTDNDNTASPHSPEIPVLSDPAALETCKTSRNPRECSLEFFLPKDGICDGTDTYSHMEPDAEVTSEQPNPTPTNPCSTKYNLRYKLKPKCNDDNRYQNS